VRYRDAVGNTIEENSSHLSSPRSLVTFCVSHRRREMYCGHAHLCVCLSAAACLHYCMNLDVTWGSDRECPLVVHYCVDLQSVNGLRCYCNITQMQNVSEYVLVLALYLVAVSFGMQAVKHCHNAILQFLTWDAG